MEITHTQSFKALTMAIDKANEIGVKANITILDTAGHQKLFFRMDDAFLGSIDISMGKAKTAMLFRMNSEQVGEFLAPEMGTFGYIGVSGGSPDQDFEIATAGSTI